MRRVQTHQNQKVFALRDTTTHRLSASFLLGGAGGRYPERQSATLARQLIRLNRSTLDAFEIEAHHTFDGQEVDLVLETRRQVGAMPLKSPTSGDHDYGLIVRPRFGWGGIGPVLAETGWKVIPDILELPQLPKSDREIPPWVLSSIVLPKIRLLLRNVDRDFELVEEDRRAPRGRVDWSTYATERMGRGRFLDVPCRFPDLRENKDLLSAIHFALKRHRGSLQTQRGAGPFVQDLLQLCESLLARVRHVDPSPPTGRQVTRWMEQSFGGDEAREALQAIQWTVDERGLAGLGELEGLPWVLPMEAFFEAWLERVAEAMARKFGGTVRTGRQEETVVPLRWEPEYAGSQGSLVPDVVIERADETVMLDAKYKRHFEEIEGRRWSAVAGEIQERHRADLLQALAYANTSEKERVTTCLVYPCRRRTWASLKERGRVVHRAELGAGSRRVRLVLAAVPVGGDAGDVAEVLGAGGVGV